MAETSAEAHVRLAASGPQLRAAKELLNTGSKLWRLQQAQRSVQPADNNTALGKHGSNGRGRGRPLYSITPVKKVGDDIAAQLLTEMSQALRTLEEGLVAQ